MHKELTKDEQEIFKVIKTIKQNYTLTDFLQARERAVKEVRKEKNDYHKGKNLRE